MKYSTDPLRNPMVLTAIRLVYTDKVTCVMANYKHARYQLTTKQLVAKCVVDGLITKSAMARACGLYAKTVDKRWLSKPVTTVPNRNFLKWIQDYESGKLRLENACAVRRI